MPLPLAAPNEPGREGRPPSLVDAQGRTIRYLRLSVTERCNLRCTYCAPASRRPHEGALEAADLLRLVRVFASLGVARVRLTGGEPLVRRDLVELARGIAALPGIDELCLTTNGFRLPELAQALVAAGVRRVNVSLDTLDEQVFRALTRGGELRRALEGIEASGRAGFERVRLNTVVVKGVNDSPESLAALVRFAWARGAVPRFIELMPFGDGEPVPSAAVMERLRARGLDVEAPQPARGTAGPAIYHRARDRDGAAGEIGFIGSLSQRFCERCNRLRVTAAGELRACLGGREGVALAPLLRAGAGDAELTAAVRAALGLRPDGHRFEDRDASARLPPMVGTGG